MPEITVTEDVPCWWCRGSGRINAESDRALIKAGFIPSTPDLFIALYGPGDPCDQCSGMGKRTITGKKWVSREERPQKVR